MFNLNYKNYFSIAISCLCINFTLKSDIQNRTTLNQLTTKGALTEAIFILKNKRNKFQEHKDKIKQLEFFEINKDIYSDYQDNIDSIINNLNNNISKIPEVINLTDNFLKQEVSRSETLYQILKQREQVFDLLFNIYKNRKNIDRINKIIEKKLLRIKNLESKHKKDITVISQINEIKKSINNFKNTILTLKSNISKDYYQLDCAKEKLLLIEKKYKNMSINFVDFESKFYKSQFLKKIEIVFLK